MKVRYSKRAITDLLAIAEYIREHNPRAAGAVAKRIRASISQLEIYPHSGQRTDAEGVRIIPIVRYPYLVFYEVMEGEVVIHHIRHSRRQSPDPNDLRSD